MMFLILFSSLIFTVFWYYGSADFSTALYDFSGVASFVTYFAILFAYFGSSIDDFYAIKFLSIINELCADFSYCVSDDFSIWVGQPHVVIILHQPPVGTNIFRTNLKLNVT